MAEEEEPVSENRMYLNQELKSCDAFGKTIYQNIEQLPLADKLLAHKLLPALLELGIGSHPPQDWASFKRLLRWPQHDLTIKRMIESWWQILARCASKHNHLSNNTMRSRCPINSCNLAAAKGIIWLQIHLKGAEILPELLPFMSNCMSYYPNCPEVSQQLAQSAVNMLAHQDFFPQCRQRIFFEYPELLRGRVGKRIGGMSYRQAS